MGALPQLLTLVLYGAPLLRIESMLLSFPPLPRIHLLLAKPPTLFFGMQAATRGSAAAAACEQLLKSHFARSSSAFRTWAATMVVAANKRVDGVGWGGRSMQGGRNLFRSEALGWGCQDDKRKERKSSRGLSPPRAPGLLCWALGGSWPGDCVSTLSETACSQGGGNPHRSALIVLLPL